MAYNKKNVLEANTEAIRVVLRLEKERREATEAEKDILRNYQGFGGLKCVLNRCDSPDDLRYWSQSEQQLFEPTQRLKQMIYRDAVDANTAKRYWESIKASVLTSFYTDTRIVAAISDALTSVDVPIRRCLDPSAGMGAFTETFAKRAGMVDAMEKDLLTARISQSIHPYGQGNIIVRQEPFEAIGELEDKEKYDLITSNIPFGDFMVYDREYSKGKDVLKRESTRAIHNYFFVKGLDCIKEGGLLAFITSQGVLDSPRNEAIRRYLMQNSRLISALRLPSGMFSDNAGTDVGSDLIVLQKQTGKEISEGIEQQFVETLSVPKEEGSSVVFKHNSLFAGDWKDIAHRIIATERIMGKDPYGKPAWEYRFDGSIDDMAESIRAQLSLEFEQRFDRKLYETGIPMTEEERQKEAEKQLRKLGITVNLPKEDPKVHKEAKNAYNLMPDSIRKQLPKLYSTEKELIGDKVAYARYFFPMGAYTAYLLEYDPKTRIGFGVVTMGYGWELGNMSLDEMEEVKIHGLGIERDLYFSPKKLHEIAELEEVVRGQYTKEEVVTEEIKEKAAPEVQTPTMEDSLSTENAKEEVQVEKVSGQVDKTGGEQTVQIQEAGSTIEESVPEGVPVLSLHRQYEQKVREIRTDVEAPREMNGQTVYFDDDHHPVMDSMDERQETEQPSLFAPVEYNLWTQEVKRVNGEIKEAPKPQVQTVQKHPENKVGKENKETHSTVTPGRKTKRKGNNKTASPSYLEPSLFDFMNEAEERKPQPITEVKKEFDASPRPFLSLPDSHLRDGSIVVQKGQVGFLSDLKRHPTFNPMDLPYAQLSRLKSYIEIRECYHRLYDYEAENHAEDREDRNRLNHLYDDYVARWGYFNQKANTDIIKMDATGVEMLFLERSENGRYVKADIFDHPTVFSTTELTVATDPMEALGASLNKYGTVELDYMSSLLPDMEESDIISSLEGRIYFNPEENAYEVADKFISGNVIEKAERIESWLLEHPDHEEAKQSLAALRAATPTPIPFADLDFNLGERWIPAKVYGRFASEFFGTDIGVSYHSNMDEYSIVCDRKNANIWHKYAVQGEFRRYDGINLLKHALHNTIPDINKSKEVADKVTGEIKTIKVRDGHAIQMANAKIEEIRQGFVDWLGRTPDTFKQQLSDRYNRLFNCFVRPNFDGTHQTFPDLDLRRLGIADLYKSQKDAVWMLKTNGGGICDHEVGAGKTLIMCTAAYEMKRLGLANKPMIIGLKANVFDIADTFRKAYPNARILYPGKNDFSKQNRQRIFNDIKNNDWDCIILTHEQFGMIPQALEVQEAILQKEKDSVEENLEVLRMQGAEISRGMLKGLEKRKQTLEAKLQNIQDSIAEKKDDAVDFKMMGIDHLFVDESHQFKNLMFNTRHDRVSGLGNPDGSQRALNMLFAIRTIQERSGKDLGATFLSGTTISNSLTELYLLFKYLRPQALEKQGINSFDAWAAVFAKKSTDYEFSITNEIIQKERFRTFIKVPELAAFYADRRIVSAISDALATSGVTLKRCLDPSSGMGAFAKTFAKQVGIVDALEKDLLTARISQALHPYGEGNIFVRNEPFEAIAPLEEAEKYDLVTSNIPFGDFMVYDREYSRGNDLFKKESTRAIHNYFFVKGLDCTREGGLVAFITSQGVLDAALNEPIRRYLMQNSRLISAIRLPSGMFSEQAGTEVRSDLIVLQKQSGKEIGEGLEKQFIQTVAVPKGDGFTMAFNQNSLFEGSWDDVAPHTIVTSRELGRDPYGKPTWKYRFEGTMEEMAESLRIQLTQDVAAHFDHKLYETGIAMNEEERQADLAPAPEGLPQAVDKDLIESYRLFMLRDLGNKESSVSNRLRHLHQVIRKALQEQYIREDPFDFIDIETPTYERNALTSDELHKLLSFRPHKSVDNHCRLIFLLGCFTGLAFSDLKKLRMDDVYTLRDGRRYISLCRTKTQNRCIVPLLPIAEEMLSIVSGGRTEGLFFREFPTNSHFNRKIREVIIKAGLPPHTEATSHTARHCDLSFPLKMNKLQIAIS